MRPARAWPLLLASLFASGCGGAPRDGDHPSPPPTPLPFEPALSVMPRLTAVQYRNALRDVLGVQTEVSFVESYVGRPMFSDIDAVLRRAGFEFFDIIAPHYMGRDRSPVTARQYPGLFGLYGHMVEAHVLYLRDPIRLAQTDSAWLSHFDLDRALKLVAIAEIYHQVEYAIELLFWLEEFFGGKGDGAAAAQIAGIRGLGLKKYDAYMRWHSEAFDRMILGAIP
mgnify:CR=1 FL=1